MKKTYTILKNLFFVTFFMIFNQINAQNGLSFDGVNDQISCGNATSVQITGSQITLEAWVYPTSWAQQVWAGNIINKEQQGFNNDFGYMLRAGEGGKVNFNLGNGSWNELTSATPVLTLNKWHHVAGTYDGNHMKIYVDGVVTDSAAASVSIGTATFPLTIGNSGYTNANRFFSGIIDEVRIWGTARTAAEINANMLNELCSTTGLQAYYRFNQGMAGSANSTITTLNDASGNNNSGTLTGFALSGTSSNWVAGKTLVASNNTTSSFSASACSNYTAPSGAIYNSSQVITDIIPNSQGCDSVMTITVSINNSLSAFSVSACDSYTAPSGLVYTSSQIITDIIPNYQGCDSIMSITLSINNSSSSFSVSACDSYTAPSGLVYTSSQTITDIIPNYQNCDSVITITLSLGNNTSNSFSVTGCGSYTAPSGAIYTTSQTITDIIPNVADCDSVLTISIVIVNIDTSVSQNMDTLTATGNNGSYQWINCDTNMPVTGATSSVFVPTVNGNYAVEITTNNCVVTSSCYAVMNVNNHFQNWNPNLKYFPNPVEDILNIKLGKSYSDLTLTVFRVDGTIIKKVKYNTIESINLDFDVPTGVYFIQLNANQENTVFKVLKH